MWAQALLISSLALLKRREKQRHTLPYPPFNPRIPQAQVLGFVSQSSLSQTLLKTFISFQKIRWFVYLRGENMGGERNSKPRLVPLETISHCLTLRPRARQASLERQLKSRTLCKNGECNHFPTDEKLKCQYFRYTGLNYLNCFHWVFFPL